MPMFDRPNVCYWTTFKNVTVICVMNVDLAAGNAV